MEALFAERCGETDDLAPAKLAAANINPRTRLATDYLNHFNNVVMLLELIGDMPECAGEILDWEPCSYPDYFATSHFRERDLAIRAYHAADPQVRDLFEQIVAGLNGSMNEAKVLLALCNSGDGPEIDGIAAQIGMLVSERMKPLVAEASGVINGRIQAVIRDHDMDSAAAQASVDELFP